VAAQFMGFWKNFIDTFSMHGYKVYITGESYAGQYIPYIASGMLDAKDTRYFNVKGVQINDPSINYDSTMIYCKKYWTVYALLTNQHSFCRACDSSLPKCAWAE